MPTLRTSRRTPGASGALRAAAHAPNTPKARRRVLPALAVVATATLGLAACGSGDGDSANAAGKGGVQVVATTDVYGSLVEKVGGDDVEVTSLINSASQDPHSYEASPRDKLAVSKAQLVVTNGGGYDEFADQLLDSLETKPTVIAASDLDETYQQEVEESGDEHDHGDEHGDHEGHHHHHGDANEHVWYRFSTAEEIVEHVAKELGEADPDHAKDFDSNAEKLQGEIRSLQKDLDSLKSSAKGKDYVMTEPVPKAMLDAAGLEDATPEGLSEAIEEGDDIPAATLQKGLKSLERDEIAVFAYNEQTADEQTQKLRDAAKKADVPVVDFTETLPEGKDYIGWMEDNVAALEDALTK